MSMYLMLAIAALAGFVGAGFIWFAWSAAENVFAMRVKPPVEEPDEEAAEA